MVTKENIIEKLKEVIDPELNVNIVDLGLIYNIKIESTSKTKSHPGVASTTIGSKRSRDSIEASSLSRMTSDLLQNDNDVNVDIRMTLTSPGCPLSGIFEEWVMDTVKKIKGVKNVTIDLVWEPAWSPERMSDDAREQLGIVE